MKNIPKVKKKQTKKNHTLHCNTHCVLLLCGIKVGFKSCFHWFEFYVDASEKPGDRRKKPTTKLVGNSCVLASPEASFISRMSTDIIVTSTQRGGLTDGLGMKLIGRPA